jgi:hypothetical protein
MGAANGVTVTGDVAFEEGGGDAADRETARPDGLGYLPNHCVVVLDDAGVPDASQLDILDVKVGTDIERGFEVFADLIGNDAKPGHGGSFRGAAGLQSPPC